jgi:hypothetical protein
MQLSNVKIIDKKYSRYDEKKSDPKKGKYVWLEKSYIKYPGFYNLDKEWFFTSSRYAPEHGCRELMGDRTMYGYEPLDAEGQFIPEGAILNTDGYWQFKDVVFCKVPLVEHLKRREQDIAIAKRAGKAGITQLNQEFKDEGAALPDEVVERMLGAEVDQAEVKKRSLRKLV